MPVKRGFKDGWDDARDGKRSGKPVNTWDTLNKGDIFATAGDHSWTLRKHGFKFTEQAVETSSTAKHWSHHLDKKSGAIVFNAFDELAAYALKKWGIAKWERDQFGSYHPAREGVEGELPCDVVIGVDQGRWTSFHNCDRIAVGRGDAGFQGKDARICKLHVGVNAKREERDRVYREERDAREAERNRSRENEHAEKDACEELAEHGIKATPATGGDGHHHGEVAVRAEDLLALAREVAQYREILGEDALA